MLDFYQNLPEKIDPVAFNMGSFSIYWYSSMYLAGFLMVAGLLYWRIFKKETDLVWDDVFDFILFVFSGSILGGRIGYVIFYNFSYFFSNPLSIIMPFSENGDFVGIYGMSYHGGVLGFVLTGYFFSQKRKINFWKMMDFVLPAVPAGYFFGRLGNFLNGELYGRITDGKWGMNFGDGLSRHPSQLYEAFFEGLILFLFLWLVRNNFSKKAGMISGLYVFSYGIIRFILEFWREPDEHLGFIFSFLTMGQILSLIMIAIGFYIISKNKKKLRL